MFPQYCKVLSGDDVFYLNGYEEIPPYRKASISDIEDINHIVKEVKVLNTNCCGFVFSDMVNYHSCSENFYLLDLDKEFVFLYFQGESYNASVSIPHLILLKFIQHKCGKLLLIYEDVHFLLKKTEDTFKICKKLDEIYCSHEFFSNVIIKAVSENNYQDIFLKLLEIYSIRYGEKDVRGYDIFNLLLKVLKIEIK